MGVLGLTTFIARYHEKYKESVYLHNCPVVIDGPNLMYFLYFEARHSLVQSSSGASQKKGYRCAGSSGKSPVAKTNGLKEPYLFGGDYITYAQNVREFFQQLKHCNVTPVVLFDGAYDDFKIQTAYKRFAESIKDNVWGAESRVRGVTPGRSYAPIFMKTAFVEILQEQKIPHFQTEGEADCTIAFVARKLGNCPILSSDSDFHMYVNAVVLPLHTLRFKKATPKKADKAAAAKSATKDEEKIEKLWTLHSQFVSLRNLCDKQFKMRDQRLILLAAVILGNDYIPPNVFGKVRHNYSVHKKVVKAVRIAFLLKWLGHQVSFNGVLDEMMNSVKQEERTKVGELVKRIICIYEGMEGEEYVWKMVVESGRIDEYFNSTGEGDCNVGDLMGRLSIQDASIQVQPNEELEVPPVDHTSDLEDSDSDLDADPDEDGEEGIRNTLDEKYEQSNELMSKMVAADNMDKTPLPEWYLESHVNCTLDTYLLKLIRNKTVFLTPQVETKNLPSSHSMAIPIIRVLGGILLKAEDKLQLITRSKTQVIQEAVHPIFELPNYGLLPNLYKADESFRKTIPMDQRRLLILDTLGLGNDKAIQFIEEWPVSLRLWVMGIVYFLRKSHEESQNSEFQDARNTAVSVALAILISVLKNSVLNPPTTDSTNTLPNEEKNVSQLLVESDAVKLSKLRKFYATYEAFDDVTSRDFKRSYDIYRPYNFCQFSCILYHLSHLNRLFGDPFRAPKVSYSINSWFIFKFSGAMNTVGHELIDHDEFDCRKFIGEVTTDKLGCLVDRILKL